MAKIAKYMVQYGLNENLTEITLAVDLATLKLLTPDNIWNTFQSICSLEESEDAIKKNPLANSGIKEKNIEIMNQ